MGNGKTLRRNVSVFSLIFCQNFYSSTVFVAVFSFQFVIFKKRKLLEIASCEYSEYCFWLFQLNLFHNQLYHTTNVFFTYLTDSQNNWYYTDRWNEYLMEMEVSLCKLFARQTIQWMNTRSTCFYFMFIHLTFQVTIRIKTRINFQDFSSALKSHSLSTLNEK